VTIDYAKLAEPFAPTEIEWRVGQKSRDGMKATLLCYLTSRAVMQRLDDVVGPAHWRDHYDPITEGGKTVGYLCALSLEVEPGQWVTKVDVSDLTDIEALKGGVSGALKRAAVKWGIGRYLYDLDARYHPVREGYGPDGAIYCPLGDKGSSKPGHIVPPTLPEWALPPKPKVEAPRPQPAQRRETPPPSPTPTSGAAEPASGGGQPTRWTAEQGRAFFGSLARLVPPIPREEYDSLAAWCAATRGKRPSEMTAGERSELVVDLTTGEARVAYGEWAARQSAGEAA
jgi:hypothetical protein